MKRFILITILGIMAVVGCKSRTKSGSSQTMSAESGEVTFAECMAGGNKSLCNRFAETYADCKQWVTQYVDPLVKPKPEKERASARKSLVESCCLILDDSKLSEYGTCLTDNGLEGNGGYCPYCN
jgi:hypothetical protein